MSKLSPELQRLEELNSTPVSGNSTLSLSRPAVEAEPEGRIEHGVAQMTAMKAPAGDHIFEVTDPDQPDFPTGIIEVDAREEDRPPILRIVAEKPLQEEPDVLGTFAGAALVEAEVAEAVLEPGSTNLPPEVLTSKDFLRNAGGHVIKAATGKSANPVIELRPPVVQINGPTAA